MKAWKYRFTSKALIEETASQRIVYGLWEKLFGCWVVNSATRRSHEIIPTWRPLNKNGVWRDQEEIRFAKHEHPHKAFFPRWRYEANAAFAGYFTGIPRRLRTVVSSLDHYQWLALDLIWQQPEFARFLDEEVYNNTQQFPFSCFALVNAETLSRTRRNELAVSLMSRKRTDLLSELYGAKCTGATLRVLNKLGKRPWSGNLYKAVIGNMSDPVLAKAFSHAESIHPRALDLLNTMPRDFLLPNVARLTLADPEIPAETISDARLIDTAGNLSRLLDKAPEIWRRRAMDSLLTIGDLRSLSEWVLKWQWKLIEVLDFPPPPFDGKGPLAPLASAGAMRRESMEMGNCLDRLIAEVIVGRAYFYHWQGTEPASVRIARSIHDGWRFDKALSIDNVPLSKQTEDHVRSLVEKWLKH